MKSEIRNIRVVYKDGVYGQRNVSGRWIYGRRPDGRTVACKHELSPNGGIRIWSQWRSPGCGKNEVDICQTEFTAKEWSRIESAPEGRQASICNEILNRRVIRKR